jgi:hypothetical protein
MTGSVLSMGVQAEMTKLPLKEPNAAVGERHSRRPAFGERAIRSHPPRLVESVSRRCGKPNYRRTSSSFSLLRWAAMATAATFGFP